MPVPAPQAPPERAVHAASIVEEKYCEYCICTKDSPPEDDSEMLECSGSKDVCPGRKWFHLCCTAENEVPEEDWYCYHCSIVYMES